MLNNYSHFLMVAGMAVIALASCSRKEANLSLSFPEDFNGKTVQLISFADSVELASSDINDGNAAFSLTESVSLQMPVLAMFMIDGRTKGYVVVEDGNLTWQPGSRVAEGTPMNADFANLLSALDEADEAEDLDALTAISEATYNANKDNIFGPYFGVEWLKWADPLKVDSLLAEAPSSFKDARPAQHYINLARLRAKTAPGQPYVDFRGCDASGNPINLSGYIEPGKYTLIDFMASWCPYCIKDMSAIKEIRDKYKDKGLEVVSVAVRDEHDATAKAVEKHGIEWNVVYDAGRIPYDLYGFSGIPHYMLIGPDGKIVTRTFTISDIPESLPQ